MVGNEGRALRSVGGGPFTATDTGTHLPLWGVWAAAADDVWAVGGDAAQTTDPEPALLRWDGEAWVEHAPPPPGDSPPSVLKVAPDGSLWVSSRERAYVRRFDGAWGKREILPNGYVVDMAFGRQGEAVRWNRCRLADALVSISSQPTLETVLKRYEERLARHSRAQLLARLGVGSTTDGGDQRLLASCFAFLGSSQIPYERVFFDWFGGEASRQRAQGGAFASAYDGPEFAAFRDALFAHPCAAGDRLAHPYFADDAPTTMLIDEMEALWAPIAEDDDWSVLDAGIAKIRRMGEALGLSPL